MIWDRCKCRSYRARTGAHVPDCPKHPDMKFAHRFDLLPLIVPVGLIVLVVIGKGCG